MVAICLFVVVLSLLLTTEHTAMVNGETRFAYATLVRVEPINLAQFQQPSSPRWINADNATRTENLKDAAYSQTSGDVNFTIIIIIILIIIYFFHLFFVFCVSLDVYANVGFVWIQFRWFESWSNGELLLCRSNEKENS